MTTTTTNAAVATEDVEGLGLLTIRHGKLIDLFDEALATVLRNIMDERTPPGKARKVILTVALAPFFDDVSEEWNRRRVEVEPVVDVKLAPIEAGSETCRITGQRNRYQLEIGL